MLQGLIVKKVIDVVLKKIMEKHNLNKLQKYVEEDNELDVQFRDIEKKCTDIGFKVTAMQTVLKDLDDDSHPPVIDLEEWESMKDTIKKIKNKKAFKSLKS